MARIRILLIIALCLPLAAPAQPRSVSRVDEIVAWGDLSYVMTASVGDVAQIATGDFHSLALYRPGHVAAWGDNAFGQCSVPASIQTRVVQIAAGNIHSMALLANGTVVCWGPHNRYGDFGQCTPPADLRDVLIIAAGAVHSLALRHDGTVVCWGSNVSFNGDFAGQCDPPPGLDNVAAIAAGFYHSAALKRDGTVVAWGTGNSLQPIGAPAGLENVVAISAGGFHTIALKQDGTVVVWGGYGMIDARFSGSSNIVSVASGDDHDLLLTRDGQVLVLGLDYAGQGKVPTGLGNILDLTAHGHHSAVLISGKK